MKRARNFSAGPGALPLKALEELHSESFVYQDFGASAFEVSHRSEEFLRIFHATKKRVYRLMSLPEEDFEVLFLQGGARFLFAILPLNFAQPTDSIDLIHTGVWTQKALAEIQRHCQVHIVASGEESQFKKLPEVDLKKINPNSAYLHSCSNNTIYGTQSVEITRHPELPLVVDMSSDILALKRPFSEMDLIFASAQKNIGPAGITMLVIRRNFLEKAREDLPEYFQLKKHAAQDSMFNTPCTFGIYMTEKVLRWIEEVGLDQIEALNRKKAELLYGFIDSSPFYNGIAEPRDRSLMNVVFQIKGGDAELETLFHQEAKASGLLGLKGHRAIGGLRASLYNAVSVDDVIALVRFMEEFEKKYSKL